jgi:hypothetical protein
MIFIQTLCLSYFSVGLLAIAVVFGPETFRFLRDKHFPCSRRKSLKAQYKRLGLPPLSTILFFVVILSLYIVGTAIF